MKTAQVLFSYFDVGSNEMVNLQILMKPLNGPLLLPFKELMSFKGVSII
jgi:hypothetical protein